MAELKKYKKHELPEFLKRAGRGMRWCIDSPCEDGACVDLQMACWNVNMLNRDNFKSDFERIEDRVTEYNVYNRKDINWLGCWTIYLPQELWEASDKDELVKKMKARTSGGFYPLTDTQHEFFKLAVEFVENRYDRDNVILSYLHVDEGVPHLHVGFTPCFYDKKKKRKVTSFNDFITLNEYRLFHRELAKFIKEKLGQQVKIQKPKEIAVENELEKLQKENQLLKKENEKLKEENNELHNELLLLYGKNRRK